MENYGESVVLTSKSAKKGHNTLLKALSNKRILSLGLASTMFEGSMYLFVFFWAPALESAHALDSPLPYGTIFASFMASMMGASLLFTKISASSSGFSHGTSLSALLAASAVIFYALSSSSPSATHSEQAIFWFFCAFEACVGVYWPCVGVLKGKVVDDASRAQVYGVLRVPLNIFVVVSLAATRGGGDYTKVFGACSAFLMAGAVAVGATVAGV